MAVEIIDRVRKRERDSDCEIEGGGRDSEREGEKGSEHGHLTLIKMFESQQLKITAN